ncbi:MAG: hypothetical protein ACOZCO_12540 [Bacteroidota bacterium]
MNQKFVLTNLLLAAFCIAAVIFSWPMISEEKIPVFVYISFAYFPVTAIAHHLLLSGQVNKDSRKFVNAFMLSSFVRIFLAMIIIVITIIVTKNPVKPVLIFALQYFLFFIVDIYFLLQLVKSPQPSGKQH